MTMLNIKNVDYSLIKKHKIVDIHDIRFKSKEELTSILKQIIEEYPDYSITYPTFHNKEKNKRIVIDILKKLKFKLLYKKPIFLKIAYNIRLDNILDYKRIVSNKEKQNCFRLYKSAIINTNFKFISDYIDSIDSKNIFERYIFNEKNKLNFFVKYNNKIIGFVTIHINRNRKFGYIGFVTLLEKYRRKGYSYDILKFVENQIYKQKIRKWYESTDERNLPMINSFLKYGFKQKRFLYGFVYKPEIAFKKFLLPNHFVSSPKIYCA